VVVPLEEIEDEGKEFDGEAEEGGRRSSSDGRKREDLVLLLCRKQESNVIVSPTGRSFSRRNK